MEMKRRWDGLSRRTQRAILIGAAAEGALKIAALADLWRQPKDRVRGSKVAWGAAIVVINSFGALPIFYFFRGRR
jgi:hypothetical protein